METALLMFLLFCSGYFSSSETALFSLPATKIRAYESNPSPRKRLIASLVLKPRDLLVTIFMLNTVANILIQNTYSHMAGQTANWWLKVGVPFLLMLFVGEIVPKNFGLQNNVALSNAVAPSINFLQNLIRPIRKLFVNITVPVSRAMFFFLKSDEKISKEELKHVLTTSQAYGVLKPEEGELIWGYFNLQEATVKTLMRPRDDVLTFDINEPLKKLAYLFVEQECSRIPVCDGSLDNVLGIITARQYLLHRTAILVEGQLQAYLEAPLYAHENMAAKALLRRFNESEQEVAIVVDEYGSITGLISREDILEQIIGDIMDLRDSKSPYTKSGPNEIIASGRMELAEFNDYFKTNLTSENNMLTIGGWLTERLSEIPKSGSTFDIDNFIFQILAADPNRIRRLYIRKKERSP